MLVKTFFSRPALTTNQQPVERFCEFYQSQRYCKSWKGFSSSMYYSRVSSILDVSLRKFTASKGRGKVFREKFRETLEGVVLSPSNSLAKKNFPRDCSWSVHFGRCCF